MRATLWAGTSRAAKNLPLANGTILMVKSSRPPSTASFPCHKPPSGKGPAAGAWAVASTVAQASTPINRTMYFFLINQQCRLAWLQGTNKPDEYRDIPHSAPRKTHPSAAPAPGLFTRKPIPKQNGPLGGERWQAGTNAGRGYLDAAVFPVPEQSLSAAPAVVIFVAARIDKAHRVSLPGSVFLADGKSVIYWSEAAAVGLISALSLSKSIVSATPRTVMPDVVSSLNSTSPGLVLARFRTLAAGTAALSAI